MSKIIHVAKTGSDRGPGGADCPLLTIGAAARAAFPGDTILVHAGEYREWVSPPRGGISDKCRITYAAAPGERVVVKGSEVVTGWKRYRGNVWSVQIPNQLFHEYNPFDTVLHGDWLVQAEDEPVRHLGQVYLDGGRLFEAGSLAEVENPLVNDQVVDRWVGCGRQSLSIHDRTRTWFSEVGEQQTTIWANFGEVDPTHACIEVNVRPHVFFPRTSGRDFITVRGFEMAHAATQWAPPTAAQPGLIGPNWARGWVIEDNTIHDSRCVGISLGIDAALGDNYASERGDRPGYQYQLEVVFRGVSQGWSKERVGSHVVRNNTIYECGQAGIAGHMGGIFSRIHKNHIFRVGDTTEFYGHEVAGIKLHAAIDVELTENRINDCSLGIWLDWQTQGTRVSRNVLYDNWRDLFVEVSHGPYTIDHNILGSSISLENLAQGGAYAFNLFAGAIRLDSVPLRSTPYHLPHSTVIAGCAVVYGGDDRFVGNIFLGGDSSKFYRGWDLPERAVCYGTEVFDSHPPTWQRYKELLSCEEPGDIEQFVKVKQPVYVRSNAYGAGAESYISELNPIRLDTLTGVRIEAEGSCVYLSLEGEDELPITTNISDADLPATRISSAPFDSASGEALSFVVDVMGNEVPIDGFRTVGPIAVRSDSPERLLVWSGPEEHG